MQALGVDEPLLGRAKDDRLLGPPVVWVGVLDQLLQQNVATVVQELQNFVVPVAQNEPATDFFGSIGGVAAELVDLGNIFKMR